MWFAKLREKWRLNREKDKRRNECLKNGHQFTMRVDASRKYFKASRLAGQSSDFWGTEKTYQGKVTKYYGYREVCEHCGKVDGRLVYNKEEIFSENEFCYTDEYMYDNFILSEPYLNPEIKAQRDKEKEINENEKVKARLAETFDKVLQEIKDRHK